MNRKYLWLFVAAAVATAGLLGASRLRNRDEVRLRRDIRRLAARMEKTGPESALAAAGRAREISEFFTARPRFQISVVPYVPEQRSEMTSAVFQARAMVDSLSIRIHDLSVQVAPDRQSAAMAMSATAAVRMGSETDRASRAFEIDWLREPEGWRIDSVRELQALRRIPDGP